jgi:ribose transport system substrate-binding protein
MRTLLMNYWLRLAVVGAAALAVASCQGRRAGETASPHTPPPRKQVRIAIITNAVAPFWRPMVVGMTRAADELGCEANWYGPEGGDSMKQRELIENAISQKVDGISISPTDPKAIKSVLQKAMDKGILVITMDSDFPESGRLAYIGTNNVRAGEEAGRAAKKVLPQGSKMIAFVGYMSSPNAQERLAGFKRATQGWIDVIDVQQDENDANKAVTNAEDALQAHPEVAGLLGLWSYNGPAIVTAVERAGKLGKIKIICFDAEPATLTNLKARKVDATVVQKPYLFGYLSVMTLYNMTVCGVDETRAMMPKTADGDTIVDTGVQVVTPDNVNEFEEGLRKMGVRSS